MGGKGGARPASQRSSKSRSRKNAGGSQRATRKAPQREPRTPWGQWAKARRERREKKVREREARLAERRRARQLRRMRRQRLTARSAVFLGLGALACGIGAAVLMLLGRPYPWESVGDVTAVLQLARHLPERQARWESLAVNHYTVEIEYIDEDGTWCGPALVEVRSGRIVTPPSPAETHWFPAGACDGLFDNLILERAFGWLERQVEAYRPGRTFITAQFDPDFGHPVHAEAGVYGEMGPGCCWTVTWRDMRPLADEQDG